VTATGPWVLVSAPEPGAALKEVLTEVVDLQRAGHKHRAVPDAAHMADCKEPTMTQTATQQPPPPPRLLSTVADVMRPPLTTADTGDHAQIMTWRSQAIYLR
jgi:hypothetical protein